MAGDVTVIVPDSGNGVMESIDHVIGPKPEGVGLGFAVYGLEVPPWGTVWAGEPVTETGFGSVTVRL
jgi:hypothetical protein